MFGLNLKFDCKSCKENQTQTVGGIGVYKINYKNYDFVPIRCKSVINFII